MFWYIQALGLVSIVTSVLSLFQREKYKMMIYLSATNIIFIVCFFLLGRTLGALLVCGALLRSVIYFIYNMKNKRPDSVVPVLFCIYYVVISIVMWNDFIDLLMIVNVFIVTYGSWQNNPHILRIGYLLSSCLLIPYDIILGAYSLAAGEVLMLIFTAAGLPKLIKSTQTQRDIAQKYFSANNQFWGSEVTQFGDFDLVISDTADRTVDYNMGVINNDDNLYETLKEIKKNMEKRKLTSIAYTTFNPKNYDRYQNLAYFMQMFFPMSYNDTWMRLIDGYNLNDIRCKIDGIVHMRVDEKKVDDIISTYIKGYHAKTDLTNLTDNEKLQVEHLKQVDFDDKVQNGFITYAYLSYYNGQPISLVCMLANGHEGYITKVCTLPTFRRKHVASSLMQFAISDQRKLGVQNIVLCTYKYSTNEKFYSYNSFVEFAQGFAFDISDLSKYEKFLKEGTIE